MKQIDKKKTYKNVTVSILLCLWWRKKVTKDWSAISYGSIPTLLLNISKWNCCRQTQAVMPENNLEDAYLLWRTRSAEREHTEANLTEP